MIYKLRNVDGLSLSELEEEIQKGGRFVVFPYVISIVLTSFKKLSPAYFFGADEPTQAIARKYSFISGILGWWRIPFGFLYTYQSLKTNWEGGLDVTKDVLINLSEESLKNSEVHIKVIHKLFIHVSKHIKKDILKALNHCYAKEYSLLSVYVGQFINVRDDEFPMYMIGFSRELDSEEIERLEKSIRKYFYNHVPFHYFNISDDPELGESLVEQGELLSI
ncbi:hypothetical protein [Pontibacter sp. G13]|uniref:hypothetical protein n=1 Tax=Pontibacter sp. G13 TaxID=3074898 RepID=UPI002889BA24|nr:hypothetical protein [Pontibacter sp. G13]WNJ17116.1 hypothetical protein RJD25_19855 [Pontibacter sp. G13]